MAGIRAEQESVGDEVMEEGRTAHAGTCQSCLYSNPGGLGATDGLEAKCSHNFRISV